MLSKQQKRSRWIVILLIGASALSVLLIGAVGFGGESKPEAIVPEQKAEYAVFSPSIPEELFFAGERVPLELFDVYESLDRELLSNAYFHSQTIRLIKLSNRFFPVISPILNEYGVPDDFIYLAVAESGLTNAVSPAEAVGFWQIRKGTAGDYGLEVNSEVDERYHLERSTVAACKYLKESYEKYGSWTMAAASYNAGRKGVEREMERQKKLDYYDLLLNEETARYLFRILSFKLIMEQPMDYGFHLSQKDLYPGIPYTTVEVNTAVHDFAVFAEEHQTNYKLLKMLNPWLRDNKLTNSAGKTYTIRIPDEKFRRKNNIEVTE